MASSYRFKCKSYTGLSCKLVEKGKLNVFFFTEKVRNFHVQMVIVVFSYNSYKRVQSIIERSMK